MEISIEEILAKRFNLENEYNAIKAHLLQKINRMDAIEKEIDLIDKKLKTRNKHK
jgi:hypothetical protein